MLTRSYPGEVPDRPPDAEFWQHPFLALPQFEPMRLPDGGASGVPNIGMDALLDFLLETCCERPHYPAHRNREPCGGHACAERWCAGYGRAEHACAKPRGAEHGRAKRCGGRTLLRPP